MPTLNTYVNMKLTEILDRIFEEGQRQGLNRADVAKRAGLPPPSVSRMAKSGNARLDKLEQLAAAVGMELTVIPANAVARGLADGNLFD